MPDHLLVIRSVATDYELQGRVRGSLDVPPCPEGLVEARSLATRLAATPLAGIYASPSSCAAETARIIAAPHGLQPRSVDLLAKLLDHFRRQRAKQNIAVAAGRGGIDDADDCGWIVLCASRTRQQRDAQRR